MNRISMTLVCLLGVGIFGYAAQISVHADMAIWLRAYCGLVAGFFCVGSGFTAIGLILTRG